MTWQKFVSEREYDETNLYTAMHFPIMEENSMTARMRTGKTS
jgi:hypothetical protein